MKGYIRHLMFLCRCLSPVDYVWPERPEQFIRDGAVSWETLAAVSDEHYVTPTLWHMLRRKQLTEAPPKDFAHFLAYIYSANTKRNVKLKAQALAAIKALNEADIEPVVLKGGLDLLTKTDSDLGARMMTDIDILIPLGRVEQAVDCFRDIGYCFNPSTKVPVGHRHLPELSHPDEPTFIELHTSLHGESLPQWIDQEELWRETQLLETEGRRFRKLSLRHALAFNVIHSEISHGRYYLEEIGVRELYDFVRFCAEDPEEPDWAHLISVFESIGLKDALDMYLYKASRLFGLSVPIGRVGSGSIRRRFERCLLWNEWEELGTARKAFAEISRLFSKNNMQMRFGCADHWRTLNMARLQFAVHLIRKYLIGKHRQILIRLLLSKEEMRSEMLKDFDDQNG